MSPDSPAPDDFSAARRAMLTEQLRARDITDPRVLEVMGRTPREHFVAEPYQGETYDDRALPIDCQQTISQPYIVALMSQALALRGDERVLEIGAGSGYQTAILAQLAGEVIGVERHQPLAQQAQQRLADLGLTNARIFVGDGSKGYAAKAPYDCILVAAAASQCPPELLAQLADPGRLIAPLGDDNWQDLTLIERRDGQLSERVLTRCRFVPLLSDGEQV